MPPEHARPPVARPQVALRFCLVAFGGAVAGVVMWCALAFVLVRLAPRHIHSFDSLSLLFPFTLGAVGANPARRIVAADRARYYCDNRRDQHGCRVDSLLRYSVPLGYRRQVVGPSAGA